MTGFFDPPVPVESRNVVPLRAPEWRVIMPAPQDAPAPPSRHPNLGLWSHRWEYRDGVGRLNGFICRFDPKAGKEIRGLVFAEHKKWGRQWRWLGFPKPRPLYGLDRLAARPDAPVIITEGEKAADAAGVLSPDHVAVTSPGGSKAAKYADWSALAGRRVTIWRDADEPGEIYAHEVSATLAKLSPAPSVAILTPPEGVAEGWDAADARSEGWTAEQLAELLAAAAPAVSAAASTGGRSNARDQLLEIVLGDHVELWHDREQRPFATIPVNGHRENLPIEGRSFRGWLSWQAFTTSGNAPASETLEAAIRVAETVALNRGPELATWYRTAEHEGAIYVDLGCKHWRAVKITSCGWEVVDKVPPKFLRSRSMAALPEPEAGELIETLRGYLNVEDDGVFRLICTWLAAAVRPTGPFTILIINGEQGSAKSTAMQIGRSLIDPNISPIRAPPKDEQSLIVAASNSWVLAYDNLSSLPNWMSDALCRHATGAGYSTRQLHTNFDEAIFYGRRPVAVNGIADLASRPDLAERAVLVPLPRMGKGKRRDEKEFWASFEKDRPGILGALFDAVAAGLRHLPEIAIEDLPRMADFAKFGAACARGFGWEADDFIADYAENEREIIAGAAAASPLVPVIETMLGRGGYDLAGFDGTAEELLAKLREVTSEAQQRGKWFPANASQMGGRVRFYAPVLRSRGIEVEHYKQGRAKTRKIVIRCSNEAVFETLRARSRGGRADGEDPAPVDSSEEV